MSLAYSLSMAAPSAAISRQNTPHRATHRATHSATHYHHLDLYILPSSTSEEDEAAQTYLESLHAKYKSHANKHNARNQERAPHEDSGFDLLVPHDCDLRNLSASASSLLKLNHQVAAVMRAPPDHQRTTGYYLYPRSSLSKTPLRLANSVGIIDAGYRGPLIAALDILNVNHNVRQDDRLVQICAPNLSPIHVHVRPLGELPPSTERGDRGFGTTQ